MIGLYKDPHGTKIFRNPHSEISGDRANGTKKIMTSRNHSASEINVSVCIIIQLAIQETLVS